MKYKTNPLFVLFFYLTFCFSITQAEEVFDDFDEFDDILTSVSEDDLRTLRSCEQGEANIWAAFLNELKIPLLFDEPFYNVTSLPTHRNVINYPNFFIFSYQAPEDQQITFHFFYNQTTKKNYTPDALNKCSACRPHRCTCKPSNQYTKDGRTLGSYLNIENGTLWSVLEENLQTFSSMLPSNLAPLKKIDFPTVYKTLANARLSERRIGFVGHYFKRFSDDTTFEAKMPFLWQIRNIDFSEEEKEKLRKEFGAFQGEDFDEIEFGKQHLVMDAFGSGTLDLTLKHRIINKENYDMEIGGSLYLPTDGHWARGWYGTYFDPKDQQPILRFCDIVSIANMDLQPGAKERIEQFLFSALDHLSSAILQCPLGYDKHFALALKALPYWQISPNLEYSGVWIFEYLFPHEHPRFFINQCSDTLFSEEFKAIPEDMPEKRLDLLERKITERLFPRVFTTKVTPGFLLNTIANLQTSYKDWNFTIGYNWWYRTKEKLSNIKAHAEDLNKVDICKATGQSASQVKLYGKVHRAFETKNHTVSFSLYGNATIFSSNIGNDFSFGISFDKTF